MIFCSSISIPPSPTFRNASMKTSRIQRFSSKRKYFSPVESQDFWIQWVHEAFPDLHRNIFLPPPVSDIGRSNDQHSSSHYKESKTTTSATSQHRIPRPTYVEYNDLRADKVLQWVLICLKKMSSKPKKKVMFVLSQLRFGQHLGEPFYAAAKNFLPSSTSFPPLLQRNWKKGDFDLLIIHPCYGFVLFEVKAFGDNLTKHDMSQQDQKKIRHKLNKAILQLERAEVMLSHLVSDIAPGVRITKTIVLPHLTAVQVQQALAGDRQLVEEICRCLGAKDVDEVTGLCLCSDQLSDPRTPWIVSSDILQELNLWWRRRVTNCAPDKQMTFDKYLTLVARLCGPAITVTVPCISPPPLHLQTSSQPSSLKGKCYYAQIALFPEQIYLLNSATPRVFLAGPPGTGKTVVLQLKAEEWLRCGSHVFVVSTWSGSRAASYMMYHVLQQTTDIHQKSTELSGQLHLLQYDFNINNDIDNAVDDLTLAAKERSLHVIADEMGPPSFRADCLKAFCDKLLTQVPHLHFWAASYYHELASSNWQVTYLTRPIRNPPSIVTEIARDWDIIKNRVKQYSPSFDGFDRIFDPPIQCIYHRWEGHTTLLIEDCMKCGEDAAIFLRRLCAPENTTIASSTVTSTRGETSSQLQYRDMLILSSHDVADDVGMVEALRKAGIPVQVLKDDDIEDVATARSDVVWVANEDLVRGVERKIIIVIENTKAQLQTLSRCAEQLMIITNRSPPIIDEVKLECCSGKLTQSSAMDTTRTSEIVKKEEAAHMDVRPRRRIMDDPWVVNMSETLATTYPEVRPRMHEPRVVNMFRTLPRTYTEDEVKVEWCSGKYLEDCEITSEDESQQVEKEHVEEVQKEEMGTDEYVTKCHITESKDIEKLTSSTLDTDPLPYPIIPVLIEASLPPNANRSSDECSGGEATEKSDDITPSPGISTAEEKNADKKSDQNLDEVCDMGYDTNVYETQEKERRKHEASATRSKKMADDTEMHKNTDADREFYSFPFKIKLDLREDTAVTPPHHIMESSWGTEEASDTSDDTFSTPIFNNHWQDRGCFSAAGGRLQKQGSDVVLQVPAGAIEVNTLVTVHAAVCVNDVYIKHKLQLPASETIVSPLAEFWASTDFPFQKHVQITLPTCLSSNYKVDFCHVYCIRSEKPEGKITISELERLAELSETPEKEKPAAYFYVKENGQVVIMTTHFSGYVCTSCRQCQNLSLDVYASHKHEDGEVRVFLRAELWDRLTLREFKKYNSGDGSYRLVFSDTFQLKKMFTPAELLMELTVSNEQQNLWQHIKFQDVLPETRKTFQLNWDKIECKKCENLPAIKYTELGPFSACWTLKRPEGAMPSTLEVCVCVSHSQIQGQLKPDSSYAPIQIDVGPHTEDENRFSNGSCDRTTINIQNVHGDLHLASQPSSTDED